MSQRLKDRQHLDLSIKLLNKPDKVQEDDKQQINSLAMVKTPSVHYSFEAITKCFHVLANIFSFQQKYKRRIALYWREKD